eukprot:752118-Hanusia_phi.AAC.2
MGREHHSRCRGQQSKGINSRVGKEGREKQRQGSRRKEKGVEMYSDQLSRGVKGGSRRRLVTGEKGRGEERRGEERRGEEDRCSVL